MSSILLKSLIFSIFAITKLWAQDCKCSSYNSKVMIDCKLKSTLSNGAFSSLNCPGNSSELTIKSIDGTLFINGSYSNSNIKPISMIEISESKLYSFDLPAFFNSLNIDNTQLKTVILNNNDKLKSLKTGAIANFPNLQYITIVGSNNLERIEDGAFDKLPSLSQLSMNNNKMLQFLPSVLILGSTPMLTTIQITKNPAVTTLPSKFFDGVCPASLQAVCDIDLSQNALTEINFDNSLANVRLHKLQLNNNQLTSFAPEILTLTNPRNISFLNLRDNKLTTFKMRVDVPSTKISVEKNPWNCDCSLFLATKNGIYKDIICETPNDYKGQKLSDLYEKLSADGCNVDDLGGGTDLNQIEDVKPGAEDNKTNIGIAIGVSVGAVVVCFIVVFVLFHFRSKICLPKKKPGQEQPADNKEVRYSSLKSPEEATQVKVV